MVHISSILVCPRPGAKDAISARLGYMTGIEVHGASTEGKLVVTIETSDDEAMVDAVENISRMADVLSVSMVFHQQESDPEAEITLATSQGGRIDKEV